MGRSTSIIYFSPYNLWLGYIINLLFVVHWSFFFFIVFWLWQWWLISFLRVYCKLKTQVLYFDTYMNDILMRKRTLLISNLVCLWLCWTGFSMKMNYFWGRIEQKHKNERNWCSRYENGTQHSLLIEEVMISQS